jgi:hypothetical protein
MSDLTAKIEALYHRIERAAAKSGRSAHDITLVTVTKTHPLTTVIAAYQAGLRHFGENRAAEGRSKALALAEWITQARASVQPTWHLIGHLQSRQVEEVLGIYRYIHSVDSLKLAQRIQRLAERDNHPPVEILLQVNVSGEATKAGFPLSCWHSDKTQLQTFVDTIAAMRKLDKIVIRGLMTMAPWFDDPEETRPTFQSLTQLRKKLRAELPHFDWSHLSMGMSDDFEIAIEEGATIIRVGRAIFGERE